MVDPRMRHTYNTCVFRTDHMIAIYRYVIQLSVVIYGFCYDKRYKDHLHLELLLCQYNCCFHGPFFPDFKAIDACTFQN